MSVKEEKENPRLYKSQFSEQNNIYIMNGGQYLGLMLDWRLCLMDPIEKSKQKAR